MDTPKKSMKQYMDELNTPEFQLLSRAHVLQGRYMVQIEKALDQRGWKKRDLAARLKVSPSYISRLFTADQFTNFKMLARIEQVLGIQFERVSASSETPQQS